MNAESWPEAKGGVRLVKTGRAPGRRARILVVDRDPTAVAVVRSILRAQDWEVITAKSGKEALSKARLEGPDAIVSEVSLPDMAGPELCRALRGHSETALTPILMLSASSGVAERVASLRAGASDYLVKPPDAQELIIRLKAALDLRQERLGFVVAVVGGKGGVGASMVAVNLALALRQQSRAGVVLVDAAQGGTVDIMLNLQSAQGVGGLLPRLEELEGADFEAILTPHASGVQALLLHEQGAAETVGAEAVRKILLALRRLRDFVVVDAPLGMDESAATILELADRVLLVLTPEITSLRGARLWLEQAARMGVSRERVVPVLNRFPQRGGLQRRDIENAMGLAMQATIPDDIRLVTYSINRGVPLAESHKTSAVARQLSSLAGGLVRAARQG